MTIWVVRLGDDLYVRSVNGRNAAWFRGVQTDYEGHIHAGGVDKDVTFVEETDSASMTKSILPIPQSIAVTPASPSLW